MLSPAHNRAITIKLYFIDSKDSEYYWYIPFLEWTGIKQSCAIIKWTLGPVVYNMLSISTISRILLLFIKTKKTL